MAPEPFEKKKQNFFIYGPSNCDKTSFIKEFCSLNETLIVFCVDTREWKGYNTFSVKEYDLLNNPGDFANSLVIFDDMGDKIRTPVVDNFFLQEDIKILL